MLFIRYFLLLLCFAGFSFGCNQPEPTVFSGHFHTDKFGDSYDTWEVINDTIYINKGALFTQKGYYHYEEQDLILTLGNGIYRLPKAEQGKDTLTFAPEPGTGTNELTVYKTANCATEEFMHPVTVPMQLPQIPNAQSLEDYTQSAYFFLGAKDARSATTIQDFSMQIGASYHLATMQDVGPYFGFLTSDKSEGEKSVQVQLYAEGAMPMEQIYPLTNTMRQNEQYAVWYIDAQTTVQKHTHGLARSLFLRSLAEYFNDVDTAFVAEQWMADPTRPQDFYDRLRNQQKNVLVEIVGDSINWNGKTMDLATAKQAWGSTFETDSIEEVYSSYILTATPQTTWQQYLTALGTMESWTQQKRNAYCIKETGLSYEEATKDNANSYDISRSLLLLFPSKIIEVNPFVYDTYFRDGANR